MDVECVRHIRAALAAPAAAAPAAAAPTHEARTWFSAVPHGDVARRLTPADLDAAAELEYHAWRCLDAPGVEHTRDMEAQLRAWVAGSPTWSWRSACSAPPSRCGGANGFEFTPFQRLPASVAAEMLVTCTARVHVGVEAIHEMAQYRTGEKRHQALYAAPAFGAAACPT